MNLQSKTIAQLKQIRTYYEEQEKLFDVNFVYSCLEAIEEESKFKNLIELVITEDSRVTSEENMGTIYFSLEGVERQAMEILSIFTELYTPETEYLIKNYFAMLTLIHETGHVSQDLGLDEDEVVNKFYGRVFSRKILSHVLGFLSCFYSSERHANIDAHKAMIDIYDDSNLAVISKTFYLNLILYLYGKYSPTEKMQKMFLVPDHFDTSSLSNMKKLEVGFPVDEDIIRRIDNELIREARGETDFYECKKRIVGISNGIKY